MAQGWKDYILHLMSGLLSERFEVNMNADIDDLLRWSDGMKDVLTAL